MNKKTLLFMACSFFLCWLNAQSLSPSVISSDGEISQTKTMSLEWTLGELATDYLKTETGLVTEGFHQALLGIIKIPDNLFFDQLSADQDGYQIDVWPSPVHTTLSIKIESEKEDEIFIELTDVMGRKVIAKTSYLPNGLFELDFSDFTSGLYLLRFLEKDGTLIKTILNAKH